MKTPETLTILVGPQDPVRLEMVAHALAPRLDYRLIADRCDGVVRACYPSPAALRGPKAVRALRSMAANLWIAADVVRTVAGTGGVVYSTAGTWGLPVGVASRLLGRSDFTHIMYVHRAYSPSWLRLIRCLRPLLHVDGWICLTQRQASLLRQVVDQGTPIGVISQGVDTVFFDPEKARPPDRPRYILSVGAEMRNYALLFRAVRDIDVDVIVKASSAWMAATRQAIDDVPSNVTLLTEHLSYPDLRDLYAGASVVVLPLYNTVQAAGITTMLEAMAMGKPVVATRSEGLRKDLIANGLSVVEPSPQRIADRVAELLDDPQRASMLAARAQAYVRENLTLEAHAGSVVSFINALSSRDRPYLAQADARCQGDP